LPSSAPGFVRSYTATELDRVRDAVCRKKAAIEASFPVCAEKSLLLLLLHLSYLVERNTLEKDHKAKSPPAIPFEVVRSELEMLRSRIGEETLFTATPLPTTDSLERANTDEAILKEVALSL